VYATWTRCGDKARWLHPRDLAKDLSNALVRRAIDRGFFQGGHFERQGINLSFVV
jgi:hypothetical protein